MSILNMYKPIRNTNVNLYVEAFGDDDYETQQTKIKIIDKIKRDIRSIRLEEQQTIIGYSQFLKEKYNHYKQSLAIVGSIGDEGGSAGNPNKVPKWFENAIKYGGEYVTYEGNFVVYSG